MPARRLLLLGASLWSLLARASCSSLPRAVPQPGEDDVPSAGGLPWAPSDFVFKHHDNRELAAELRKVHERCADITRMGELAETSVLGTPIVYIEVSDHPGMREDYEPTFRYVGNMHGNEVSGRELLLRFAHDICDRYLDGDEEVRKLVEVTRIFLIPSMNPDGWEEANKQKVKDYLTGRANAKGVDLNRDFPDLNLHAYISERSGTGHNHHFFTPEQHDLSRMQPETRGMINLMFSEPFVLSANLHNGALVANYPYDKSRSGNFQEFTDTPDGELFRHLARSYADLHPKMGVQKFLCISSDQSFISNKGITNGAQWYSLKGDSKGNFWRLLIDGSYLVQVSVPGYQTATKIVQVVSRPREEAQQVDFVLTRQSIGQRQSLEDLNLPREEDGRSRGDERWKRREEQEGGERRDQRLLLERRVLASAGGVKQRGMDSGGFPETPEAAAAS